MNNEFTVQAHTQPCCTCTATEDPPLEVSKVTSPLLLFNMLGFAQMKYFVVGVRQVLCSRSSYELLFVEIDIITKLGGKLPMSQHSMSHVNTSVFS